MSIETAEDTDVSYREETEDAYSFVSESTCSYKYPPTGPNSQLRSLRLVISQSSIDSSKPGLRNLLLPLEIILIEETGKTTYEDVFAYDLWGQFLYHGWRKYDKSKKAYVDADNNPIDDKIHNDANPTKAFEYGEAMSTMTKHTIFPERIERNPAIKALRTHTLWQLHH
jgi:hypothetical protein